MSTGTKRLLWAAAGAAVLLMLLLGFRLWRDGQKAREMTRELSESRARWEETAARKEELQEELKAVSEELREAQLTLEESTARAAELREEISRLEEEIEALRNSPENRSDSD